MMEFFTTTLGLFFDQSGPHLGSHYHFAPVFWSKWSSSRLLRPLYSCFLVKVVLISVLTTTLLFFPGQSGPHLGFHDHFALVFWSKWSSSRLLRPLYSCFSPKVVLFASFSTTSLEFFFQSGRIYLLFDHLGLLF